jgi:hypothetical protein
MIQADIYSAISGSSDVTAIAGNRVYPVRLPRTAVLPAVVYFIPSTDSVNSLTGDSGVDNNSIQISCWAKDYKTAHLLANAVRASLATIKAVIDDVNDDEDEETMNYCVIMSVRAWSIGQA